MRKRLEEKRNVERSSNGSGSAHGKSSSRRAWLGGCVAAVGAAAAGVRVHAEEGEDKGEKRERYRAHRGRIRQSVVPWCFRPAWDLETLARHAVALGIESVELCSPEDWPILKRYGLVCAITSSHGFEKGLNDPANHPRCLQILRERIEATAAAGFSRVITFSGMRGELDDETGIRNTVNGVKQVIGLAEEKKVDLCLEVLNTRDDSHPMKGHPGYQADKLEWAKEVCDRVGSERMKILFDIYHVQIMQGDVIRRIRELRDYIGHFHTAGVPGRGELDDTQEINYPPILRAIAEIGYKGFVGQEFIPTRDPLDGLEEAVRICDV